MCACVCVFNVHSLTGFVEGLEFFKACTWNVVLMDKSVTSHRCLTEEELSVFRTQPCVHRALKRTCPSGDDCVNSHCLSWCRRDPYNIPYRARLCPFVIFRREQRQTRVKNFCNRRRWCPYAHTKEEQMYHPSIYKTKLCRIHPHCSRACCPFGTFLFPILLILQTIENLTLCSDCYHVCFL